jgi:phosphoenolpyruvate carboxykinase (ATP)
MAKISNNPSVLTLIGSCLLDGCKQTDTKSIVAYSGEKTGRSPKDKRIVSDDKSKNIWWGDVNMPINKELYNHYKQCAIDHLFSKEFLICVDAYAGWNKKHRIKVRVYCSLGYHGLFIRNMLIPSERKFNDDEVDFTIYNAGDVNLDIFTEKIENRDLIDNSLTDTLVALNLTSMDMVIIGTKYAGEMKKGILTLMMYLMPLKNCLTLHSSANVKNNKVAMFFGLSGTGKTTLSADSDRSLIGDDEHVWTSESIFNVEGGWYAKLINLDKNKEPEIYDAMKFGTVMENVVMNEDGVVDYTDISITPNTRAAYPLHFISNSLIPATINVHPKNIIFLTCDAFGLLPPVSKLTKIQAEYHFVNGYTSKVPGTEVGIDEPVATFSACYGEPFLIWNPSRYARLLGEMINKHKSNVWLVNTGWINGPYGVGERISLSTTRNMINSIHNDHLLNVEYELLPILELVIPKSCDGVDSEVLNPMNGWDDKEQYLSNLNNLKEKFHLNYQKKIYND